MKFICENGRVVITGVNTVEIRDTSEDRAEVRIEKTTQNKRTKQTTTTTSVKRRNLIKVVRSKKLSARPGEWAIVLSYRNPKTAQVTVTHLKRKSELANYEFQSEKGRVWGRYVGKNGKNKS